MEMICAHAQWHKRHVFGQSHISLDTGSRFVDAFANITM